MSFTLVLQCQKKICVKPWPPSHGPVQVIRDGRTVLQISDNGESQNNNSLHVIIILLFVDRGVLACRSAAVMPAITDKSHRYKESSE